jgi:uncharacterized membrane protein
MAPARSFPRRARGALACIAAAMLLTLALAPRAEAQLGGGRPAGWSICNETRYVLEAATARPDGRAILVQGWVRLRPGECRLAVAAPLARGTHYLYARTSTAHRGGRRQWGGEATLCVDPTSSFAIENPPQCAAMGLEERRFRRVQINKRESWRTSFADSDLYSLSRARAAGIQQLLQDAGYTIPDRRGGLDPRQISAAIAQFRAAAHLAPNATEDQLIDALETAARRRADQLGLTLCNRTHARMWTAIGRRGAESWESRGWWGLAPNACVRAIDDTLTQQVYYVYAAIESPTGDRQLAAAGEPFCTSPARFAIYGRDKCEERYYDTAMFSPISSRGRPGMVIEFDERDFLPPPAAQPASQDTATPPPGPTAANTPASASGGAGGPAGPAPQP